MFRSRNSNFLFKFKNIIWPKKGFQRSFYYLRERILRMSASTHALSLGLACGAAASMTPFLGLHFIIAAVLAYLIRGNLFTSAIGTIVGNPWSFPLIFAADNYVGGLVIDQFGLAESLASLGQEAGPDMPMLFFFRVTIGGAVLAVITFPIFYSLSYWGLASWRNHRQRVKQARMAHAIKKARDRQEPVFATVQDQDTTASDGTASQPPVSEQPVSEPPVSEPSGQSMAQKTDMGYDWQQKP